MKNIHKPQIKLFLNIFLFLNVFISLNLSCIAHLHSERSYQNAWCSVNDGIEEYRNKDHTRVDCLTDTHAVEFDFANKWAESVGQALHYQLMTNKRAKVVLILEDPTHQKIYYNRVLALSRIYDFDVEYITTEILNINEGKCNNPHCKCNKLSKT